MPTPDTTVLDLVRAGEYAAATDALRAGWPDIMLETLAALCLYSVQAYAATSSTSNAIGTGSKTFTLTQAHGWPSGLPVRIMDAAAPTTNFMVGTLSAAETGAGVITVNVTAVAGSGTKTSWTIVPLDSASTVVSPPVSEANGGTAATTFATARTNMELTRRRAVKGVAATPPGGPTVNDLWAVHGTPTGAWVGHAGDWAQWSGLAWTFTTPSAGDQSFDTGTSKKTWTAYSGGWRVLGAESMGNPVPVVVSAGGTLDAVTLLTNAWTAYLCTTGPPFTTTLPTAASAAGVLVTLVNLSAATITINVSGGGTINSTTSVTVVAGASIRLHAFSDGGSNVRWLSY